MTSSALEGRPWSHDGAASRIAELTQDLEVLDYKINLYQEMT
ncbi:hypothetical protein ACWDLG_08120 [Nonomuraea sp. NPDC003727]